ncbi:MFS transporter, partial [Legionella tunisiensis]|uniref:MFS transporter n=1 Tax=Legionella tunisiensis TaxID=1034944 RepID=UPI0004745B5D
MSGRQKITLKQSILVWGTGDIYFIVAVMISVLFSVLSPDIKNQLKLSNTQLGLLGTAFFLCYGIAQLFTGRLFDRIGPKITLASSAFIAALGLLLMAVSQSFAIAITAKIITGIGLSTSYIGAIYLANTWFSEERFALISGITQMSSNILTALLVI